MKSILIAITLIFIGLSVLIADTAERKGDEFVMGIKALTNQVKEFQKDVQAFEDNHIYVRVTVTTYNPLAAQTDSTPFITASNQRVRQGIIALSRDLEKGFGRKFGDKIHILGHPTYEFQDRMSLYSKRLKKHIRKSVDIFMWSKKDALQFGRQQAVMVIKG